MDNSFKLTFRPDHSSVKSPDFEEQLALRLLDIILGRQCARRPDPVPFSDESQTTRMIGSGNNFWLIRDLEYPNRYTVQARYFSEDISTRMQSAETIIRTEWKNLLEPKEEPKQQPACPTSTIFKLG